MQDNTIRNYLKSKDINYEDCVVYQDFGISGTTDKRPEYQKLLTEVSDNDIIIVYELSRLWRDVAEQSKVLKMLKAINVSVFSISDGEIKNISDKLMFNIKGAINEFEADRLKERINAGIAGKKARMAAGNEIWKGRGPDKKPRSKEGYFKRWQRVKIEIEMKGD
jgi:DNA invertase Pin-like site-specific DNA recombinase